MRKKRLFRLAVIQRNIFCEDLFILVKCIKRKFYQLENISWGFFLSPKLTVITLHDETDRV